MVAFSKSQNVVICKYGVQMAIFVRFSLKITKNSYFSTLDSNHVILYTYHMPYPIGKNGSIFKMLSSEDITSSMAPNYEFLQYFTGYRQFHSF